MVEIILIITAILLRVTIVWLMYNIGMELYKFRYKYLTLTYGLGFLCYTSYTFGVHLSQDINNPIRLISLLGLCLMFGAVNAFAIKRKKLR